MAFGSKNSTPSFVFSCFSVFGHNKTLLFENLNKKAGLS